MTAPSAASAANQQQVSGTGTGMGQQASGFGTQLANTGGGPLYGETLLGGLLALIGVALLKPKAVWKRLIR